MWTPYHVFDRLARGQLRRRKPTGIGEASILLAGSLLVLCAAELLGCHVLRAGNRAIYIVLIVSHFESSMYLYSFMRAIQTILAVLIVWFINVKLFLSACSQKRQWMDHEA